MNAYSLVQDETRAKPRFTQVTSGRLQRAAINPAPMHEVPPLVHEALRSPGLPLDAPTRAFMEPRFGHDFSGVRVHTDAKAAESAQTVNALAYTVGRDVVFGVGQYSPQTSAGRKLMAHELTHAVQQDQEVGLQTKLEIGPVDDQYERQADTVAERIGLGNAEPMVGYSMPAYLQRKTGDGHDLTARRFAGNAALEEVFDGKKLIRRGDKGTAVRLIQESLLAQGYTLPKFGADGDFGGETESAIRQFQTDAGAVKLDGIVGSETLKLLDMHDPGATTPTGPRSAAPPVIGPPAPPATGAVFSESPQEVFAGYDNSVAPNWLVVPVGGRRQARVTITPAIARPAITSAAVGIAHVDPTPDGVTVTGIADGHTRLEAREGATLLDTLNVEVKDRRDLTVDHHFMRDSALPRHHTVRGTGQAPTLTSTLNRIWERQANVRFRTGTVDSPTVPTNLGPTVMWTGLPADGWNQVTAFATGGNYNVFYVWEYEQDATPAIDNANAGTLGWQTLLEDNECGDALTIAHEAGHAMGLAPGAHPANGIMSACGGLNRLRVTKADGDIVNP